MGYDYLTLEAKWQKYWEDNKTYYCDTHDFSKPKYYCLDMFPYPSGQGLHVGHVEGYTATDIVSRYKRTQGFNVLHPIGWDSFGLPAEQYAISTGNHPDGFTKQNIENFKRQIKRAGFSYDFDKEIATSDPSFYKYTQWIFLELYKKGLAYIDERMVNYCPELGTVLANEEVIDGLSERGNFPVIRKSMKQWVLKITAYAQSLLDGLENLDWPNSTLEMQRNWIGKSLGTNITFKIKDSKLAFEVFTTRADTLFGCTYCVLAPEHPLVSKIVTEENKKIVSDYQTMVSKKSDLERTELNKAKSGVFTGAYAINPANNTVVPIYIGDYVLATYGSGAVMAVPAHDERDYDFAKKYQLPIIQVIEGDISVGAMIEDGIHINSSFLNGLKIEEAKVKMTEYLQGLGSGDFKVNYKLRDWLFSRQRYWGEPIPIIHMEDGTLKAVASDLLPLVLPELEDYAPAGDGLPPLAKSEEFVNVVLDGKAGKRETNIMPQWAGSSWYFLRYIDPHNNEELASKELLDHWMPVDLYIGGAEHAVLHLLYARFWNHFLNDEKILSVREPFKKLRHQGMILGADNQKMSKSRGNVVNPDEAFQNYGADALRLYEMFKGPLEASLPWSPSGLEGAKRFLDRVYRLYDEPSFKELWNQTNDGSLDFAFNSCLKKVTEDYEKLQFNTAIAAMMVFINECYKASSLYIEYLAEFAKLLAPVCPHLGAELYELTGHHELIDFVPFAIVDLSKIAIKTISYAVSINGKKRDLLEADASSFNEEAIKKEAQELPNIKKYLEGKTILKIVVVKDRIVNFVIKE